MNIILMGSQGSGKGTQAAILAPRLRLDKIATGDLFRAAIAQRSDLGLRVEAILERGDLVPDALTNAIVERRLADVAARTAGGAVDGALFDGFPRTPNQAATLDGILAAHDDQVDAVVEIAVPHETLIARMSGRRVCPVCGHLYHIVADPPTVAGICDVDGATLVQRDDDLPEAIARRLALYAELTAPLIAHYEVRGIVRQVDGSQPIDAVTDAIVAALGQRN